MTIHLLILAVLCFGLNMVIWGSVGAGRWLMRNRRRSGASPHAAAALANEAASFPYEERVQKVAILIAAHNEQAVIEKTLRSALRLVPANQIFVASDGSTDATVGICRAWGVNVLDLQPNRGKAGALRASVEQFGLASFADYVVLLDADTELAPNYLQTALPMFEDPEVSVVAGRAATQWRPAEHGWMGKVLMAHRERLYFLVQRLQKYGQAAANADVVAIAPGFASIYRAGVLSQIEMDPPGLVIEDFNMTFEVHRRKLGRIAFEPSAAVAYTQDPSTLGDYRKQVLRWALGFWQTVRWHGMAITGRFRAAMVLYCMEALLSSVSLLLAPLLLVGGVVLAALQRAGIDVPYTGWAPHPLLLLALVALPDLLLSALTAVCQRRIVMIAAAPAFLALRVVDAWLCLRALKRAFGPPSSGRWESPVRRVESSMLASAAGAASVA